MQLTNVSPIDRLRGEFGNLQRTAAELTDVLAAPFAAGPLDAAGLDRLTHAIVATENFLTDADVAEITGRDFAGVPTFGAAVTQARTAITELFDPAYERFVDLRVAYDALEIPAGFDAGPVADLRHAAATLRAQADAVLAVIPADAR